MTHVMDKNGFVKVIEPGQFANPTANTGLTTVNGTAATAMRSDAAPALDLSIAPAWTGKHLFKPSTDATDGFRVQDRDGNNILVVDTVNNVVTPGGFQTAFASVSTPQSLTTTSWTDITNMAVTISKKAGTKILVFVAMNLYCATPGQWAAFDLKIDTSDNITGLGVGFGQFYLAGTAGFLRYAINYCATGLAAGSHTIQVRGYVSNGSYATTIHVNNSLGTILAMEVPA